MNYVYVYVIYFDGEMYKNSSRKISYLEEKNAKVVVTQESKYLADNMAKDVGLDTYDMSKEEKDKYIEKAKSRFEIKKFVEEK